MGVNFSQRNVGENDQGNCSGWVSEPHAGYESLPSTVAILATLVNTHTDRQL